MEMFNESLKTPVSYEADVIVAGGGSAGFAAALNSGRHNARTILIEREFMTGGIMTAGLMCKIAIEPYMTGIPTEFIIRLGKEKMAIPYEEFPLQWPISEMTEVPVDPEASKLLMEEMLEDAGVTILYGTVVVGVVKEGNTVKGVIVENKDGRSVIKGKVFIDATGDGDLCARAGAEYEFGQNLNGVCSASNMLSRLSNVNIAKTIDYVEDHPGELYRGRPHRDEVSTNLLRESAFGNNPRFITLGGFSETIDRLLAENRLNDWEKDVLALRGGAWFMNTPVPDQVLLNVGRVTGLNPLNAMDLSKAVIEGRKQNWFIYKFLKDNIPGFEDSFLIETGSILGIRETRRIICDHKHTIKDFRKRVRFDDAIMRNNDSVEFHNPYGSGIEREIYETGEYEEISYRSIVVKGFHNVMAVGRCWSADQLALSANRSIGFCMGMGQAAGMAGAMAVCDNISIRNIDINRLQRSVYPKKYEGC